MSVPVEKRVLLAERLFDAAVVNIGRSVDPPANGTPGAHASQDAKNYADAALRLTQAWCTVTRPGERTRA